MPSGITTPIEWVRPSRRLRAVWLTWKPWRAAISNTLWRVVELIRSLPDKARDTVAGVTPAIAAMSASVRTLVVVAHSR